MYRSLGLLKSLALPAFHALTGCDIASSFYGHGKRGAWNTWETLPDLTDDLITLSSNTASKEDVLRAMPTISKFVVRLYGVRERDIKSVDEARLYLLHKGKNFDSMPQSSDTLHLHVQRATYQLYFSS